MNFMQLFLLDSISFKIEGGIGILWIPYYLLSGLPRPSQSSMKFLYLMIFYMCTCLSGDLERYGGHFVILVVQLLSAYKVHQVEIVSSNIMILQLQVLCNSFIIFLLIFFGWCSCIMCVLIRNSWDPPLQELENLWISCP